MAKSQKLDTGRGVTHFATSQGITVNRRRWESLDGECLLESYEKSGIQRLDGRGFEVRIRRFLFPIGFSQRCLSIWASPSG